LLSQMLASCWTLDIVAPTLSAVPSHHYEGHNRDARTREAGVRDHGQQFAGARRYFFFTSSVTGRATDLTSGS
jgi:hypothetical protein